MNQLYVDKHLKHCVIGGYILYVDLLRKMYIIIFRYIFERVCTIVDLFSEVRQFDLKRVFFSLNAQKQVTYHVIYAHFLNSFVVIDMLTNLHSIS